MVNNKITEGNIIDKNIYEIGIKLAESLDFGSNAVKYLNQDLKDFKKNILALKNATLSYHKIGKEVEGSKTSVEFIRLKEREKKVISEINTIKNTQNKIDQKLLRTIEKEVLTTEKHNKALSKQTQELIKSNEALKKKLNNQEKSAIAEKRRLKQELDKLKLQKQTITTEREEQRLKSEKLKADKLILDIEAKKARLTKQNTALSIGEKLQLQETNKKLKQQARENLGLVDAYEKLNRERNEAQRTLASLLSAEKQNQKEINKASRNYERLDKKIKAVDKATKNYSKNVGNYKSAFQGLNGVVKNLITSLGVIGGASLAVEVIKNAYKQAKELDTLNKSLKAVTKSEEQFGKSKEYLSKIADDYGVKINDLTKSYVKFTAASKGTRLEGEKANEIFDKVTKSSAQMGLSADETGGVLKALEQIMSKGKVQAEELRGQLGDRLPGAFNIMARAMGVSTAELDKMLQSGKVMADDVLPKFAIELEKTFGADKTNRIDNMVSAENRFSNAWTELIDNVEQGNGSIGKTVSGVINLASTLVNIINPSKELNEEHQAWREGLILLWDVLKYGTGLFLVYKAVIISVGLAKKIATAYTLAYRIAVVAMNRGLVSSVRNLKFLRVALINTGIGAVLVAVTALVVAFKHFNKELTKAERLQKINNQLKKESASSIAKEKAQLDTLIKTVSNENVSKEKRLEAIKKINEVSPEYLKGITIENIKTQEGKEKIDEYIKALDRKAFAQALQNKKTELYQKVIDAESSSLKDNVTWYETLGNMFLSFGNGQLVLIKNAETGAKNRKKNIETINDEIKALNKLQKKIAESDTSNTAGGKQKTPRQKQYYDDAFKLIQFNKQQEIEAQNEILNNAESSFDKKVEALTKRVEIERSLEQNILNEKLSNLEFEKTQRLKAGNTDAYFFKSIANRKLLAQAEYNAKTEAIKQQEIESDNRIASELVEQQKANSQKEIDNIKKATEDKINAIETARNQEITTLNEGLDVSNNSQEDHERELRDLKLKYNREVLEEQIKGIEKIIDSSKLSADVRGKFEKELSQLKRGLSELDTQQANLSIEQRLEKEKEFKDALRNITNELGASIQSIGNSLYQRNIDNIDEEIQKNEEKYSRQIELAQGDADQQDLIRREAEAKRLELEKKKKKEQKKQAIFNRTLAIADIAINTSKAIIKSIAESPLTFGLPWSAFATATGALQLASVLAQPIPAYAKGTDNHEGGLAIVGEERPEVITEPNKDPYIVSKPSLLNLPRHTIVTPSVEEYQKIFASTDLNSLNNKKTQIEQAKEKQLLVMNNSFDEKAVKKAISDGFKNQKVNFHTTASVNLSDEAWKRANIDW